MDLKTCTRVLNRPLRFGDPEQIYAYEHLERVAAIERVLEGDDSEEHVEAVRDAITASGWLDLLTGKSVPVWRGY